MVLSIVITLHIIILTKWYNKKNEKFIARLYAIIGMAT